ncbi:MAG TPA: ATP-dependent DNA ligase [Polyangiaceae bacterium]
MLLDRIAETSENVAGTRSRTAKVAALAVTIAELGSDEVRLGVAYLAGELPGARLGVGYAGAFRTEAAPAAVPSLGLVELDRRLAEIAALSGAGSAGRRKALLGALFSLATEREQRFLRALLVGELRQGALSALAEEALARAFSVPLEGVRRAAMLSGDLGAVAVAVRERGAEGLAEFRLEIFRPVLPMLAQSAPSVAEAYAGLEAPLVEYKLDGARVQLHKRGDDVRVFTRNLNEVSARVPEIVEAARAYPAATLVLDGEVLALRPDGRPEPFQVSMRRFGAKVGSDDLRRELPLSAFFFDVLHAAGEDFIDRPLAERVTALGEVVPGEQRVPYLIAPHADAAAGFLDAALAAGHEGVLVKAREAGYEAGRRGAGWVKVKPVHTLDLVVLAAEWGSGRRRGFLSNLHLGARGPGGTFVMLGKTFKGMTDALLAWQTEALQKLEVGREGHVVHVRPELVVEIAFDGVQQSREYPGGVALRFARVRRYRSDKTALEADGIERVRALAGLRD